MIKPDTLTKFSGPPGTGKSTTLLNAVDTLLSSGVDPVQIVYTTFTRAGAHEASDRAASRFKLSRDQLPYFRTLHSLCFHLLPRAEVMHQTDWFRIASTLGLQFSWSSLSGNEATGGYDLGQGRGDYLLHQWSMARARRENPETSFARRNPAESRHNPTLEEFLHFIATVEEFKRASGKIDFTEMLERWLDQGEGFEPEYVIVDEAQDLSILQWAVIAKLCQKAKGVWVAGDDDQCIYEWNGASPETFIDLKADNYSVLPQSYRMPAKVHDVAQEIIQRVQKRLPKEYRPREEEGNVTRVAYLDQVKIEEGSWFMLGATREHLKDYMELCHRRGLLYQCDAYPKIHDNAIAAIHHWKALAGGSTITAAQAKVLYGFLSRRDRVKNGFKQLLLKERDDRALDLKTLENEFGLIVRRPLQPWHEMLDQVADEARAYLKAVEQRGGLTQVPRIKISTIHGVKGREADHVILRTDLSVAGYDSLMTQPDTRHRLFYVAVTRARKTLHLLEPQSRRAYTI